MSNEAAPRLSVVAPAFNEAESIERVVRYWQDVIARDGLDAEIVITDDGSTDATLAILTRLADEFPNLRIERNEVNGGYGAALTKAIRAARADRVLTLDSDGQFDLADHALLTTKMREGDFDVVTGYRDKKKDRVMRTLADRTMNMIIRIGFGCRLRDTNCAMKLFKADVIRDVNIEARGYPAPTDICLKLVAANRTIGEVMVRHLSRTGGDSKVRVFRVGWRFLWFLFYLRIKLSLWRKRVIDSF